MRLIVFGASGGCGSQLVSQAAARGHQVTAVIRVEEVLRGSGLDWQAVRPIRLSGGAGTGRPRITGTL